FAALRAFSHGAIAMRLRYDLPVAILRIASQDFAKALLDRNICTNKNTTDKSKDDTTATPMHNIESDDSDMDNHDDTRNQHHLDTGSDTANEDVPLSVLNKKRARSDNVLEDEDMSTRSTTSARQSSPSTSVSNISVMLHKRKIQTLTSFADSMSRAENEHINKTCGKLFFGCNIPFSVIDSDLFKNFVQSLRPSYRPPCRKTLSNSLLNKVHAELENSVTKSVDEDSVLLINGWKNESNNTQNVATLLHNTQTKTTVFLDAWDISGGREGEKIAGAITQTFTSGKEKNNTNIYAVCSDNAANMMKMGRTVDVWHSTCNSHTANLLAKQLVPKVLTGKNLINNLPHLRKITGEFPDKIGQNVVQLLFNEIFITQVNDKQWLLLKLPEGYPQFEVALNNRRSYSLTSFSLSANFLHPVYNGKHLNTEQNITVEDFLIKELDASGLTDLENFKNNRGIFQTLKEKKNVTDPSTFWGIAKRRHVNLATLALKLLNIPASSAQLERVFSSWSFVHSPLRNKLDFERSKKLLFTYHSLKLKDKNKSDEY
ncbi:hypothetical protein NQ315_013558, partial [Exocentrus adspersus]